jgi:hypothetical protein
MSTVGNVHCGTLPGLRKAAQREQGGLDVRGQSVGTLSFTEDRPCQDGYLPGRLVPFVFNLCREPVVVAIDGIINLNSVTSF